MFAVVFVGNFRAAQHEDLLCLPLTGHFDLPVCVGTFLYPSVSGLAMKRLMVIKFFVISKHK